MKPQPCESCAAGKRRAECPTYPIACEDILEFYEQGVADERERAAATNARLHRRCQLAEKAARQNLDECRRAGVSFGRSLANWAGAYFEYQLEELVGEVEDWIEYPDRIWSTLDEQYLKSLAAILAKYKSADSSAIIDRLRALDAKCALLSASLKQADARADAAEARLREAP